MSEEERMIRIPSGFEKAKHAFVDLYDEEGWVCGRFKAEHLERAPRPEKEIRERFENTRGLWWDALRWAFPYLSEEKKEAPK